MAKGIVSSLRMEMSSENCASFLLVCRKPAVLLALRAETGSRVPRAPSQRPPAPCFLIAL